MPIIGTITGVAKTVIAVRDKLLVRKIYSFLIGLKDVSFEERQKFVDDLENNSNYQRQVGENLIMLLDRLDDLDKPFMISKIFKAHLRGDINYHQFLRFASVIDRMLVKDLQNLLEEISSQKTSPHVFAEYLYPFGLSKIEFDDSSYVKAGSGFTGIRKNNPAKYFPPQSPVQFKLSKMTYLLAQILLSRKVGIEDYVETNRKDLKNASDQEE